MNCDLLRLTMRGGILSINISIQLYHDDIAVFLLVMLLLSLPYEKEIDCSNHTLAKRGYIGTHKSKIIVFVHQDCFIWVVQLLQTWRSYSLKMRMGTSYNLGLSDPKCFDQKHASIVYQFSCALGQPYDYKTLHI